jgi:hypothetical protein
VRAAALVSGADHAGCRAAPSGARGVDDAIGCAEAAKALLAVLQELEVGFARAALRAALHLNNPKFPTEAT